MVLSADERAWLEGLGSCLVLAPHPDDETLGCGGLIALLRQRGATVSVILVSDGTQSHPRSRQFTAEDRRELRHGEMQRALARLGVESGRLHTLGLPDAAVPGVGAAGFASAVERIVDLARRYGSCTLVAPWRRDPHPDHRAVADMAQAARDRLGRGSRLVEYEVWTGERGTPADRPHPGEALERRLDVSAVASLKRDAIREHASQLGRVILDDPAGFILSPSMIERCTGDEEIYLEVAGATSPRTAIA